MSTLHPSVVADWIRFTDPLEGTVQTMYLDMLGLVTIGIGNLIDPKATALQLPFLFRGSNLPASRHDISDEWDRVKSSGTAKSGWRAAERVCQLYLTMEGVRELVYRKLEQNHTHLEGRFPEIGQWPALAQMAVHSLAWACGPAFRFPMLEACLRSQNWARYTTDMDGNRVLNGGAAFHCEIDTSGADRIHGTNDDNYGVIPRNLKDKSFFEAAQYIKENNGDYSSLLGHTLGEAETGSGPIIHVMPDFGSYRDE